MKVNTCPFCGKIPEYDAKNQTVHCITPDCALSDFYINIEEWNKQYKVRTRFAPSPTGKIHIGNLRTALFSYLIAKHNHGDFILRIEDTDQKRSDYKYESLIYKALNKTKLFWDEGPDININNIPYRQSERKDIYIKYAKQLIKQGDAYYCFCPDCHSDLERYKPEINYGHKEDNDNFFGYNGHCRNLSKEEIEENLKNNKPYVIRQKLPLNKDIEYNDKIYGKIKINTSVLDDQVLIKQDGFPTYNFANVIDDHLMNITHVIRGNEYINSTPKYILLYQAFGWDIPEFIHLPLINIIDENGKEHKLSKRFGSSSLEDLLEEGYLPEAIINYIVFLGWNPKNGREIFNLKELIYYFDLNGINKASKVIFDKKKLDWFNKKYIEKMNQDDFIEYCKKLCSYKNIDWTRIAPLIQTKIENFALLNYDLSILNEEDVYSYKTLFEAKKHDYNKDDINKFVNYLIENIKDEFTSEQYYDLIKKYETNIDFRSLMYIYRIIITGRKVSIFSATQVSELIGKDKTIERLKKVIYIN